MLSFVWSLLDIVAGWLGLKQQQPSLPPPPPPPPSAPTGRTHTKCRNAAYPRSEMSRGPVPDERVSWTAKYGEYAPVDYTAPSVAGKPVWADQDFKADAAAASGVAWNALDGKVDRRSHDGPYNVGNGLPLNPVGRTGVTSRGLLGRWGPNHAADPIVTRWKRTESGEIVQKDGCPMLEFIAIERSDSGEWALPGGMVDPGEAVSLTLKREFLEEAMDSESMTEDEKKAVKEQVNEHFQHGIEVYRGYVDDPRNTDNAWMETVALNFHDESGNSVGKFKLHAGDDAVGVQWMDMHSGLSLYASHLSFIHKVADIHNAFW